MTRYNRPILQIACSTLLALVCCTVAAPLNAQSSAEKDAELVQPFVHESTFLVVKIDLATLKLPDLARAFGKEMTPGAKAVANEAYNQLSKRLREVRTVMNGQPVYFTGAIPRSDRSKGTFAFVKKTDQLNSNQVIAFTNQAFRTEPKEYAGYLVATPSGRFDAAKTMATFPAVPRDDISEAFETVSQFPIQVLLSPPPHVRRTLRELPTELPEQLGGGSSTLFTEGVQWASLGIDPAKLRVQLTIQSASDEAANKLAAHLPTMLDAIVKSARKQLLGQLPPEILVVMERTFNADVEGSQVLLRLDGLDETNVGMELLGVLIQSIEDGARRQTNSNRFKQILLGFHNYHDVWKSFPPAEKYRGKDGKPQLSWRVHILPFVENNKLYEQFRLDEPWDSPHNLKLLDQMPNIYKSHTFQISPSNKIKPGYTTFQTVAGEDTAFGQDKPVRFRDFRDGTSNTFILVEVKPELAVPWTKPDDYRLDLENPGGGLWVRPDGTWLGAMADGSVHFLAGDIAPETLLTLFQKSDGKVVPREVFGR